MATNLVTIPLKRAAPLNTSLSDALRGYLVEYSVSDELDSELQKLDSLRAEALQSQRRIDPSAQVAPLARYYRQLCYLITRVPHDIGLSFAWFPLFSGTTSSYSENLPGSISSTQAVSHSSLLFERACILFNLASLYASIATQNAYNEPNSPKSAVSPFQTAASIYGYLRDEIIPKLNLYPDPTTPAATDLTPQVLDACMNICLAQAQECAWRKAVVDRLKNGVISKLAAQVSLYYSAALEPLQQGPTSSVFPAEIVNHVKTKKLHFHAASQYRKSCDDLAENKYGHEISRLNDALDSIKKALSVARKLPKSNMTQDIKELESTLTENVERAKHDNDLIYLQIVPSTDKLPPVQPASMVSSTLPNEIKEPVDTALRNQELLFKDLPPYGIHVAMGVYEDRKKAKAEEIRNRVIELGQEADDLLHELNLPASIQALEAPIGLPPSLIRKAEHVRTEQGPATLRCMIDDARRLGLTANDLMHNIQSMLAQGPALENVDMAEMETFGSKRLHIQNQASEFVTAIDSAASTDQVVLEKFTYWEDKIVLLAGSEEILEASIPKNNQPKGYSEASAQIDHTRRLRALLEQVDDLGTNRQNLLQELDRLLENDNIRPELLKYMTKLQQERQQDRSTLTVNASEFEDFFSQRLIDKYESIVQRVERSASIGANLLDQIKTQNDAFIQSRINDHDSIANQRQESLQTLYDAYSKYCEIKSNLQEGIKFYNDLCKLLNELLEKAKRVVADEAALFHNAQQKKESISPSPSPPANHYHHHQQQPQQQQQQQQSTPLNHSSEEQLSNTPSSSRNSSSRIKPGVWDPSSAPLRFG